LRAIGANRSTIIGMILAEGLLQGLVGSFFGILFGYLVASGLLSLLGPMMNSFLHVQLGGPIVSPGLVLLTVGLGIGATVLASLIPAINAGKVTPIEALRPTFSEAIKPVVNVWTVIGALLVLLALLGLLSGEIELTMVGGLMFLVGLVLIAPAMVKPIANVFSNLLSIAYARDGTGFLAKGNLTRQPARAAITASTTMIALAIIVAMGGMIWSMVGGFLGIMERSLGSDFLLMPPSVGVWGSDVGAQQDLADKLRSIQGVELVSTMRFASTKGNGISLSLLGIDPEIYPQVASLTFREGDPQVAFPVLSAERSLIANGIFAAQAKLKIGDSVRLSTPTGSKDYRIVAIAGDYLNAKISTAYISQHFIEKDFRKQEDVFFQINLSPGVTTDSVEPKLAEVLKDYPQFSIISGEKYLEQSRQTFNAIFSFYFVLLGVMAMPSLIALVNTLAIGVLERTREIGMLRAIGAERSQVRRMIVAESLLLTSIGIALGLLAGLYLGYVLVLGMSTNGYPISYVFPYAGLLAAIAVGLIFGVIAALFPARQAARMDVVKALHYE
jgi:putative ABC transport system permease protein